ncbi:MAG: TetR/AcrR family transcriptional regulator [Acidobacteriaceae bacterium]|nr:TetR/AcrR family transcriptional regulator [Acidobacteriaceae bacterium]
MSSVSSKKSSSTRRTPQQPRSERSLATILEVTARLFAQDGYDATTMTRIAALADISIGGLYHYFPDKESIGVALSAYYGVELATAWQPLISHAAERSLREFVREFLEILMEFTKKYPAFAVLATARIKRQDPARKQNLRLSIARAFQAKRSSLSDEDAMLAARVTLQLTRTMVVLHAEATEIQKPEIVRTFEDLLTHYLDRLLTQS